MTEKAEIQEWFEMWWANLPVDLFTSRSRGSKAECWIQVEKLNPDMTLRQEIDAYTRERAIIWRKLAKTERMAPWKHAVRLIRHRFWMDDLPSVSMAKLNHEAATTACRCGEIATNIQPVDGPMLCATCWTKVHGDGWRENLIQKRIQKLMDVGPVEWQPMARRLFRRVGNG